MLHLISPDLRSTLKRNFLLCITIGLGITSRAFLYAADTGLIGSIEGLIEVDRIQYEKLISEASKNPLALSDLSDIKSVKLDPQFTKSILFNSEKKYVSLISKDPCFFYAALQNGLLRTVEGQFQNVVALIEKTNGERISALVPKENFLGAVYQKECFTNRDIANLFELSNLKKTLAGITFTSPKNATECGVIYNEWTNNLYTLFLCQYPEKLKTAARAQLSEKDYQSNDIVKIRAVNNLKREASSIAGELSSYQRNYLQNLCDNLESKEKFCKSYTSSDVWSKVLSAERDKSVMNYKCQSIGRLKELPTEDQLKACRTKMLQSPRTCVDGGGEGFPSYFPFPDCKDQSDALLHAHLKANYHDCPGNIDNIAITNIHRLMNHFAPRDIISTPQTCSNEAEYSFAKLNFDFENEKGWPLRVCYDDRLESKEICLPYIPGHNPNTDMSETYVMTKILGKLFSIPSEYECSFIPKEAYNPVRLQFKTGCHIVVDRSNCTPLYCPKQIYLDQKDVSGRVRYEGVPTFDYLPTTYLKEKFSMTNILTETYKLNQKGIKNLTELTFYFDQNKDGIIHGVGCLEDLRPEDFPKKSFNQCMPIPFIIDGVSKKSEEVFIVLRLATDDVHSPRLLAWNHLFSAIKTYQSLHPLGTWTLFGIKK